MLDHIIRTLLSPDNIAGTAFVFVALVGGLFGSPLFWYYNLGGKSTFDLWLKARNERQALKMRFEHELLLAEKLEGTAGLLLADEELSGKLVQRLRAIKEAASKPVA